MPTSYVECPDCGKRALSVATRCPGCGFQFPPRPIVRPSPAPSFGASRGMLAVGSAVLALLIVGLVVRHGRTGTGKPDAASFRPADSVPAPASPMQASPAPRSPAPAVARSAPASSEVRRYAQTWVNVRGERTRAAPTVGMLNPGDAVTVDSLVRGWYRVLVDGRTLGYVHRSTLVVSRPE